MDLVVLYLYCLYMESGQKPMIKKKIIKGVESIAYDYDCVFDQIPYGICYLGRTEQTNTARKRRAALRFSPRTLQFFETPDRCLFSVEPWGWNLGDDFGCPTCWEAVYIASQMCSACSNRNCRLYIAMAAIASALALFDGDCCCKS